MKPAEKYRAWKAHRPEKPIFRTILFSMMAVLLAEVILLSTGIGLTNVSGRLNQNAKQIVNMQVRNRASYLQDMLIKAQELTDISTTINNLTQQMLQDGTISLDTMDQSSEAADPLMEAAAPYLVSALRARPVTGIFLVINTHDLAEKKVGSPMPSVYLRDLDPDARPSERKADLMIERSSAAVVKKLGITTDKSWSTALSYRGLTSGGFACTVFQTAWEDDEKLDAADYGRWLTQTYKLTGDERTAIAYSQPLILPDGTVYGVIGVEILTSYLETKMPYQELQDGGQIRFADDGVLGLVAARFTHLFPNRNQWRATTLASDAADKLAGDAGTPCYVRTGYPDATDQTWQPADPDNLYMQFAAGDPVLIAGEGPETDTLRLNYGNTYLFKDSPDSPVEPTSPAEPLNMGVFLVQCGDAKHIRPQRRRQPLRAEGPGYPATL